MFGIEFCTKQSASAYVYLPPEWSYGFQRSICLKSCNVQKWKIRFTIWLNAAKNRHDIKKASNKSCLELNFAQKSLRTHISISPRGGVRGLERLIWLKYYLYWNGKNTFNLELTAAKNTHQIKKVSNKSCFDLMRIFGSVEPQSESNFPFLYIIRFQTYWSLEPLAPLQRKIDICARGLFGTKFKF